MKKLKPCPFCGDEQRPKIKIKNPPPSNPNGPKLFYVSCCLEWWSEEEATTAWNRRVKRGEVIKHIPFNPLFYGGSSTGQPSPVELIPEGYVLEKVVPISDYEWVLVCWKDE